MQRHKNGLHLFRNRRNRTDYSVHVLPTARQNPSLATATLTLLEVRLCNLWLSTAIVLGAFSSLDLKIVQKNETEEFQTNTTNTTVASECSRMHGLRRSHRKTTYRETLRLAAIPEQGLEGR